MFGNVIIFITLFSCWYAFSGQQEPFYIISGLAACFISTVFAAKIGVEKRLGVNLGIVKYLLWLAWQVVLSSIDVTIRVWGFKTVNPGFAEINVTQDTAAGYTIYGNSVTLTPGTVTVDIDEAGKKVLIHSISVEDMTGLQSGEMDLRVARIIRKRLEA